MLRLARIQRGWTQAELGQRFGCSGSTISRFETGERRLADVAVLRRLAAILGLPPEGFGLTPDQARPVSPTSTDPRPRVGPDRTWEEVDESVRRRAFLLAAGLAGSILTAPAAGHASGDAIQVDPAALLTARLQDVLFAAPPDAAARPVSTLNTALVAAASDFHACRYLALADRLPRLITAAQATNTTTRHPEATAALAQAYNLATRVLLKLEASGLEWVAADRALQAAHQTDDPLTLAEAQRLMGSVCRRVGHHDQALDLTLHAAAQLDPYRPHAATAHLARYGLLMCSASYACARAGDRDRAIELLNEATATRLDHDPLRQHALEANVLSHRVSTEYVLGNAGIALQHARRATATCFPDTERRARFLVDVALSYGQLGKPDRAYRTLLAAEHTAPDEVRTRATVRHLVTDLLNHHNHAALPGLRGLAARTHVPV